MLASLLSLSNDPAVGICCNRVLYSHEDVARTVRDDGGSLRIHSRSIFERIHRLPTARAGKALADQPLGPTVSSYKEVAAGVAGKGSGTLGSRRGSLEAIHLRPRLAAVRALSDEPCQIIAAAALV